jgi:undecaprenyl-diphosphatase
MADSEGDQLLEHVEDVAQRAAASEATSAPVQHRRSVRLELTLLLLIVAFVGLTLLVTTTSTQTSVQGADLLITRALQAAAGPLFGSLMLIVSWAGYDPQSYIIVVLIVLLLYGLGLRWEALVALIAAVLEITLNLLVKDTVRRVRPSADLVHVLTRLNSYSFPSGHVTYYVAFFGFLWFLAFTLLKSSWIRTLLLVIFGGLILLVGISRIYLGEHWASDVLGGYLLGSLALIASIQLYRWGKGREVMRQPVAPEKERG